MNHSVSVHIDLGKATAGPGMVRYENDTFAVYVNDAPIFTYLVGTLDEIDGLLVGLQAEVAAERKRQVEATMTPLAPVLGFAPTHDTFDLSGDAA